MSNSTPILSGSLFDPENKQISPEAIADQAGFKLAYIDHPDGNRYYSVQDWIAGVTQSRYPRGLWSALKRRYKNAQIDLDAQCRKLPYKTTDQKIYKMDYATAQTLFSILNAMSLRKGIVSNILLGATYKDEHEAAGFVYLLTAKEIPGKYKIGMTNNVNKRIHYIEAVVPVTIQILHVIECSNMRAAEKKLHHLYGDKRLIGEWFALEQEDVEYIQSIKSM